MDIRSLCGEKANLGLVVSVRIYCNVMVMIMMKEKEVLVTW